jgi:hypothetical protein
MHSFPAPPPRPQLGQAPPFSGGLEALTISLTRVGPVPPNFAVHRRRAHSSPPLPFHRSSRSSGASPRPQQAPRISLSSLAHTKALGLSGRQWTFVGPFFVRATFDGSKRLVLAHRWTPLGCDGTSTLCDPHTPTHPPIHTDTDTPRGNHSRSHAACLRLCAHLVLSVLQAVYIASRFPFGPSLELTTWLSRLSRFSP